MKTGLLLCASAVLATSALHAQRLEDFGYRNLATGLTRPMLVVLADFATAPALTHDRAYYEDFIFNRQRRPSVNGYYHEVSNGRFTWARAGVIGPISFTAAELGNNYTPESMEFGLRRLLYHSNMVTLAFLTFPENRKSPSSRPVDLYRRRVHSGFMNFDISHLLESWEYQPGQVVVRKFVGKDGVEKIQLRVDLGLLQMNAHGRPDGKRPFGQPSLFDYHLNRFKQYQEKHDGSSEGFALKPEDCAKLQLEALQYHHRYICLLQLEDYGGVVRDTERNLRLFEFVSEHAESEELGWSLQQFRPQVLMLRARARATQKLMTEDYPSAIGEIESAVEALREFYGSLSRPELADQSPEIQSLEHWMEEIKNKRPLSKREQLEIDLSEAVKREDYEKAAKVRDALRKLESSS